jgi:hypothetical protein
MLLVSGISGYSHDLNMQKIPRCKAKGGRESVCKFVVIEIFIKHINSSETLHLSARSLYPLRHLLTENQVFNAVVFSKYNYMSLLWGAANKTNCNIIERRICQAARVILMKRWFDRIKFEIHSCLKWLLPHELHTFHLICFKYKTIHSQSICSYFGEVFKSVGDLHSHGTRNTKQLFVLM